MKCIYCGGEMEKEKTTYTIDREGYHLFLEDVPAYVCSQCGEKHFPEEEVEKIQNMIRGLEKDISKVRTES